MGVPVMSAPAPSRQVSVSPGRQAMRRAMWHGTAALAVATALIAAVDAGARQLGPALVLVGAYWGARSLREWWKHLDEQWFLAEVALVSLGWVLLAGAFATGQYVAFSLAPGAFYMDPEYARLVSPRYRLTWARESTRTAAGLGALERARPLLLAGARASFALDTVYEVGGGVTARLTERCDDQALLENCPRRLLVRLRPGAPPILVDVAPAQGEDRSLSAADLQGELAREVDRQRGRLTDYARRLADPAAFVQPELLDFLYDTAVAFSGNDAGIFVPTGALARACKIVEFLASLLLFGAVVSRLSTAADLRAARERAERGARVKPT